MSKGRGADDPLVAVLADHLLSHAPGAGVYDDDVTSFGIDGRVDLVALAAAVRAALPVEAPAPQEPAEGEPG